MRIGIFILLSLMLSCNSSKQGSNNGKSQASLELNGNYKIVSLNGNEVADQGLELIFDAESKSINASSTCNKIFGSYSQTGSQLSFSAMGATKMYCEGRMQMEKDMTQGMTAVNSVKLQEDGTLGLMNDEQVLMRIQKID